MEEYFQKLNDLISDDSSGQNRRESIKILNMIRKLENPNDNFDYSLESKSLSSDTQPSNAETLSITI